MSERTVNYQLCSKPAAAAEEGWVTLKAEATNFFEANLEIFIRNSLGELNSMKMELEAARVGLERVLKGMEFKKR